MFLHVSVILFTGVERGGGIPACIAGGIPACLAAGLQGGGMVSQHALLVSTPHPGGKLRGLAGGGVSRPTPKGEVDEGWALWGGGSPVFDLILKYFVQQKIFPKWNRNMDQCQFKDYF